MSTQTLMQKPIQASTTILPETVIPFSPLYVNVIVDVPLYAEFTYIYNYNCINLPQNSDLSHNANLSHDLNLSNNVNLPQIGTRVLVEFGTKQVIGFIWRTNVALESLEFDLAKLKPILHVFNDILPQDMIDMVTFVSKYYHYPIGQTLFTAIPTLLRKKKNDDVVLDKLYKKQYDNQYNNDSNNRKNQIKYNQTLPDGIKLNEIKQDDIKDIKSACVLNTEQTNIVKDIIQKLNTFYPSVLHGITGSGKTEVYLELIATVIERGLQVLVLVPEINLTPQLLKRFSTRFSVGIIYILTSNVNENNRLFGYRSAINGDAKIVIGTRLAVFTPFKSLGLIIVDEEHDQSFKQNEGLRYNARDLAVYRANYLKIPIVLGSATPSLESLYNHKLGRYYLYELHKRAVAGADLPKIQLIDLQRIAASAMPGGLSDVVIDAINDRIKQHELSLIFINRRGYAPLIRCYECGFVSRCKNCSSNMVYHNYKKSYLKCHHCGKVDSIPIKCPECGSQHLQALGNGTQKIEEAINTIFPTARIFRIDYDTTNTKDAWDTLYHKINNHEVDILVGTQMLAKGHDFPNLTLVVGLNLDSGLYSYDFRATEFLFAQLMQVAGRAGRGSKAGLVMLQTYYPRHELYQYLCRHDFSGFADYLLEKRKILQLPPYSNYALFRASHPTLTGVMKYLNYIFEIMQKIIQQNIQGKMQNEIYLYPPVPCVMQRLKNQERGQILITSINRMQLHNFLENICTKISLLKPWYGIRWHLDIDPLDL